jgi:hypothetical protein
MAADQGKHSASRTQGSRRRAHALTKPHAAKPQTSTPTRATTRRPHRSPKKPKKPERLPASLRYTEIKRGKTTIRRYDSRSIYRLEEVKGKTVDRVEIFLAAGHSSIVVVFDDKTSLSFAVDPGFTLIPEHYDWKTGDWRPIKRWPLIRSESHRS